MKRIYIAGKIGSLPQAEWEGNFARARKEVEALGHQPVCPTQLPHQHDHRWISYMREDLKAMLECDGVYAQINWADSPGAQVEVALATALGLEIIYQNNSGSCRDCDGVGYLAVSKYPLESVIECPSCRGHGNIYTAADENLNT